jgi:hypothetical protein
MAKKQIAYDAKVPFFTRIPYGIKRLLALNAVKDDLSVQDYVTQIIINYLKQDPANEKSLTKATKLKGKS